MVGRRSVGWKSGRQSPLRYIIGGLIESQILASAETSRPQSENARHGMTPRRLTRSSIATADQNTLNMLVIAYGRTHNDLYLISSESMKAQAEWDFHTSV